MIAPAPRPAPKARPAPPVREEAIRPRVKSGPHPEAVRGEVPPPAARGRDRNFQQPGRAKPVALAATEKEEKAKGEGKKKKEQQEKQEEGR